MNPFAYTSPKNTSDAAALAKPNGDFALPVLKSGGMDLLDRMKEGLEQPDLIIDLTRIEDPTLDAIKPDRIGGRATLAMVAESEALRTSAPILGAAAGSAATPQIRNVATVAGNLLQETRCWYWRMSQFDCLRKTGDDCPAREGDHRFHVIFQNGPCLMVHPSNLAPALLVLDGEVEVVGGDRSRIAIRDLYPDPAVDWQSTSVLSPSEIITGVRFRSAPNSAFIALKQKQSFDWPMVSGYAALELDGDVITSARTCAGAVAPRPHLLPQVDAALAGISIDDDRRIRAACELAVDGADPLPGTVYKTTLLPVAIRRAVNAAASLSSPDQGGDA